jgi:chromosomal replication initiation ATPase DnaA
VTGFLHALVEDAAREAGVPVAVIRGPCRRRYIARPRQKAMRRAYEEGFTTTQIGVAFNRDHTTVLYAAGALSGKKPKS